MAATFVASEVGQGLRRNLSMTLAMIITTAVALGMLGAGLLVAMTASASQDKYDYLNEFRVYVDRSISLEDPDCAAECGRILQRLETTPGVASVEYKNPEQTYAEFVDLFSSTDPVLVESTSPDALGSRFTLTLTDPTRAEAVARDLAEVDGIEIVQGQGELVERVFSVLDGVRNAAFAIAVVQLLATVLLIANMTQIAAFTRRTALGIMRLVGASRWYTELPFVLEAVIAAVAGALLAVGGLLVAKNVFLDRVLAEAYRANLVERITTPDILLLAPGLVVAGAVVSALTAWIALRLTVRH
ncbi:MULTISPECIES: permease-like cell division protein FtsX [Dietzia]|jgi:cell division transport system permease protein|uniref:Cell division protein FtsX n=1 Tax=Dietzia maris TaxID=37915 RepID=A0A365PCV8_9ACTN|nr:MULTISPECIES: permease-like cell division protein FtsX [Dietzia]ODQ97363.1 cell division protein FtsX [Dietzia alimentaria]MCT1434346.1 permease-like cell division protein FtsX [Dietzia maris]MCT1521462.1 permease-like cell division protein FtsX [Dietzia maris]MCY1656281.1 permease-like cell division protein FtsX [Dietzia sp. SL131]MCZ4655552.1 permease-like cell division protein FtsX [Dietzia kunjamensis]